MRKVSNRIFQRKYHFKCLYIHLYFNLKFFIYTDRHSCSFIVCCLLFFSSKPSNYLPFSNSLPCFVYFCACVCEWTNVWMFSCVIKIYLSFTFISVIPFPCFFFLSLACLSYSRAVGCCSWSVHTGRQAVKLDLQWCPSCKRGRQHIFTAWPSS